MAIITKPLKGYELLYEIDELGNIYSLPKRTLSVRQKRRFTKNNSGYTCVVLCKDGKHKTHTVHKLVMETFVGERPNKSDVDHINGVKSDNRLINLRYCTRAENMKNARSNGYKNYGEYNKFSKLTNKKVECIRSSSLTQSELSIKYGVSVATISRILNRKIWVINDDTI